MPTTTALMRPNDVIDGEIVDDQPIPPTFNPWPARRILFWGASACAPTAATAAYTTAGTFRLVAAISAIVAGLIVAVMAVRHHHDPGWTL